MSDISSIRLPRVPRRQLLQAMAGGAWAIGALGSPAARAADAPSGPGQGRIRQGACPGAFGKKASIDEKCRMAVQLGLAGIDFVDPNDWPTLKKHGLICTMVRSHSITKGFNRKENHEECLAKLRESIEAASAAGYPSVICFSGNRGGLDDETGLVNCVEGLKKIAPLAEQKKVTLCMELLNSKRNHKDYQCDHTAWGVAMCKRLGSPRVKLLYDIYHMQIQEGDVIATIQESIAWIGHFHTAGVPGRHEIDDTQELHYPAIMRAITETKYDGYVSHEYGPKRDALQSLRQAVATCNV